MDGTLLHYYEVYILTKLNYIYLEINSNQSCYINVLYTENYNLVNLVGYCIIKYIFILYCKLHLGFSFTFSVGKKP